MSEPIGRKPGISPTVRNPCTDSAIGRKYVFLALRELNSEEFLREILKAKRYSEDELRSMRVDGAYVIVTDIGG